MLNLIWDVLIQRSEGRCVLGQAERNDALKQEVTKNVWEAVHT